VAAGAIKETGMLASASDHHIFDKLGFRSKQEAIERYLQPILTACEHDITPRIHLEDCTRADIEGWVLPFMERVLEETGGRAKFRICDTIGDGVPDPLVPMPFGIPHLISTLQRETGAELEFHGHNDFGLATANSLAAWLYGCVRVNTAFAGLGERTGNTSLEQMLALSIRLWGDPGLDLPVLAEIAELIDREVVPLSDKYPIIGRGIFTTQAGIHQTGVERQKQAPGGLIYLPYSPALVGQEEMEFHRIGALSGMDGLVAVLNAELERRGLPQRFSITSKAVYQIYERVQAAYDAGIGDGGEPRRTFFTPQELVEMAREIGAVP
jgi:isopropylmalate/homocitrate/citramalate synthase